MIEKRYLNINMALKLFFTVILFELVIGGSGHFLEIGPITVRMLLYGSAILISFVILFTKGVVKKNVIVILSLVTISSLISAAIGYLHGASIAYILEDFKPLSFFYILLFFSIAIRSLTDIYTTIFIIKTGAILLAIIYLIVVLLLLTGKINFLSFYASQKEIGEVFFRNETLFFYKGFLYLCIGFLFFLSSKGSYKLVPILLLFSCIVLTLTRGFILFTIVVALYYIFFINKRVGIKWFTMGCIIVGILYLAPIFFEAIGEKSDSDSTRYTQIDQVFEAVNPITFLIGHGFGIGVPIREVHMELSFLEIFHKQGIFGIFLWLALFTHISILYFNLKIAQFKKIALPFVLGVVFVILQSLTNPFMNNPIGMTMILITVVVLSKLLELQKIDKL